MRDYIRLLRPKHCLKNILVLLPVVFGGELFSADAAVEAIIGFIVFSLLASVIYIINDIQDADSDRLHPTKRLRPIASGAVSKNAAAVMGLVIVVALVAITVIRSYSVYALACLLAYLVLNIAYSYGLKDVPIADIAILVSGFMLRVMFGSAITKIAISNWLYLTVLSLSFYMGFGKRRGEMLRTKGDARKVLNYYTYDFLDKNMHMFLTLSIVFYSLWSISTETAHIIWTVPVVILLCLKYSLTIDGESDGDPIEVLYGDKVLFIMAVFYAVFMLVLLYFG